MRSCLGKRVSSLPHVTCKVSALSQPSVARNAMLQGAIRVPCCSDTEEHTFLDITDRWGRMGPRAARIAPLKRHPISIDFMIDKNAKNEFGCSQGRFLLRRARPILSQLEGKIDGPKSHFGQNQLGIYMIFGKQHASKLRGQYRGRQEAQKSPNERFWPRTQKSKNH